MISTKSSLVDMVFWHYRSGNFSYRHSFIEAAITAKLRCVGGFADTVSGVLTDMAGSTP